MWQKLMVSVVSFRDRRACVVGEQVQIEPCSTPYVNSLSMDNIMICELQENTLRRYDERLRK